MPDEDKSKIDRLKDALYSRKVKIKPSFVLDLHGHENAVEDKWSIPPVSEAVIAKPKIDMTKMILWSAIGFFTICAAVALYVFLAGSNLISARNIKVDILGPSAISSGEITTLEVAVTNNNDTTLEIADLLIEYPTGTRSADDGITAMPRARVALGNIAPGETVRQSVSSILYGEEGKGIAIPMQIEYRLPNASSVFRKDLSYEGLVGTAPLNVTVEALKEVNAQQDYTLKIMVKSNSKSVARDMLLVGNLPQGFDLVSITPEPVTSGAPGGAPAVWNLGDIEAGGSRSITVTGKMYGDKDEQRYFKFSTGVSGTENKQEIGAIIASVTHEVAIKRPFIGVALVFDKSDAGNFVARSGSEITGAIKWQNNLDVPIYDLSIETVITGGIVDHDTIKSSTGFYDSNKGSIRWNGSFDKQLKTAVPGESNGVDFSFVTLRPANAPESAFNNPEFTISITVKGKRRLESGVPEEIISTVQKTIKVVSSANITSQVVHTVGPIENDGELPPRVGQRTKYTVIWAITNTFNPLANGKVVATLPDYVIWEGVTSPSSENISYNPNSREVTWQVGGVNAQTGKEPVVRQAAFQIGITPSISQLNEQPTLVNIANFSASDTFTQLNITDSNEPLTTELSTDPAFKFGDDTVIE